MMNLLLDIYLMNANLLKNYQMHGSRKVSKKISVTRVQISPNSCDEYLSVFIECSKVS